MNIRHIAMYVSDLERSRVFYETYFSGVSGEKYHNPKTGLQTYFLTFDNAAKLEIMSHPEWRNNAKELRAIGFHHLAFGVGSREMVDALTERLEQDGYSVVGRPRVTGDGYYESVVLDPDGNQIEITI